MTDPQGSTRATIDELLDIQGLTLVWVQRSGGELQAFDAKGAEADASKGGWVELYLRLAERSSAALELGTLRQIINIYDERCLVLGRSEALTVGILLDDPSAAGLGALRIRAWLERQGGDSEEVSRAS